MLKLNFNPFPVLQTKRLLLRQITDQDANELFALRSNESIMKYLDRPLAKSLDDALELIKKINTSLSNNDGITWAISLQKEKKLSGTIGFWKMEKENYRAEIGYMLHPALQGIGIMDEAVKEIINYGFAKMKLHSIEANINPAKLQCVLKQSYKREENIF